NDARYLEGMILKLSDQVSRRLRSDGFVGRTVTVKLRDSRYVTRMIQRTLAGFTADHRAIFGIARDLLRDQWNGEPLRLIGVTVSQLERAPGQAQRDLFSAESRREALGSALDRVRDKLGESSLVPAGTLAHQSRLSHVPFGAVSPRPKPKGEAWPRS